MASSLILLTTQAKALDDPLPCHRESSTKAPTCARCSRGARGARAVALSPFGIKGSFPNDAGACTCPGESARAVSLIVRKQAELASG